jgi:hypothetical protein
MTLVIADRVKVTTSSTGTGSLTLGSAVGGYQTFASIGNGNTTYYAINSGVNWEVGLGTYSSTGPTLTRTTVLASSNAGSAISVTSGSEVFATYPAWALERSPNRHMVIAVSDETTALTTGTAKVTFRAPHAMFLYQIPRASVNTVSSSGNPTVDINVGGSSIFTTTLSIDANEKTSTTAATAAVLSTTSIADDAEITIDIDTAGTGAKGLKVTLYYREA